jgi:hypothetical protein
MPKVNGAHAPQENPHYQLTMLLLTEFKNKFGELAAKNLAEPVIFSTMSTVALSQLAAVIAVDVGMNQDQFAAVCRSNYEEAFKRAPRFS